MRVLSEALGYVLGAVTLLVGFSIVSVLVPLALTPVGFLLLEFGNYIRRHS